MPDEDLSDLEIVGEFYDKAEALHHCHCLHEAQIDAWMRPAHPQDTEATVLAWHIMVHPRNVDAAIQVLQEAEPPPTLTGALGGLRVLPVVLLALSILTMLTILLLRSAGIL